MEVRIDTELKARDLFDFMMYHTYSKMFGFIGVAFSISALFGLYYTRNMTNLNPAYRVVLLISALLFTVIQPLNIYYRSARQVKKSDRIDKPITYIFDTRQIELRQGEATVVYEWGDVVKVHSLKRVLIIYVGATNAFILPKRCMGDQYDKLKTIITKSAQTVKIKMR